MINELPRALGDKDLADAGLDAARFGELVTLLRDGQITPAVGKSVLAQMIQTGKGAKATTTPHSPAP